MNRPSLADRPLIADRHPGAWLALFATVPLGLWAYYGQDRIGLFTWDPGGMMGINYRAYHHAAELALAGEPFYGVAVPGTFGWTVYLYPPVTVVAYYPFMAVEWTTGYAVVTLLSVLASVAATALIVDYVESLGPRLGWLDIGLILAAFLLSTHSFGTIYYGNVNLLLALAIVLGFWALARDRETLAGVAFGIPALFKVFPAFLGLWLLRDRRWRATGVAVATGLGALAAGIVLFGPDTTVRYFTEVLAGRTDSAAFVGGYPIEGTPYLTVQQPLSHLLWAIWPTASYTALAVLAVAVLVPVLAFFYRDLDAPRDRLMAMFVTVAVALVVFPSFRWYIVFLYLPLVALLYTWDGGPGRVAFVAGSVLLSLTYSIENAISLLAWLPDPLYTVWFHVAGFATLPLYGLGVMVAACAWHRRAAGTSRSAGA